jgi:hypothetical protein
VTVLTGPPAPLDDGSAAARHVLPRPMVVRRRPWGRAVMVLVAIIGLGVLGSTSPVVRDQLALSATRMPVPYVELYFPRAPSSVGPASVDVPFVVVPHDQPTSTTDYAVTVCWSASITVTA